MTIALGVFIILFTLTLGVYSFAIKAEQRTIQLAKLQQEAQLINAFMVKKIRSSRVDYDFYQDGTVDSVNGETTLALRDKSNQPTIFRFKSNSLEVCIEDCSADEFFHLIPASDVTISNLHFYINPPTSPFKLNVRPSKFPRVTIVIELENIKGVTTKNLLIQLTVPQRLAGF